MADLCGRTVNFTGGGSRGEHTDVKPVRVLRAFLFLLHIGRVCVHAGRVFHRSGWVSSPLAPPVPFRPPVVQVGQQWCTVVHMAEKWLSPIRNPDPLPEATLNDVKAVTKDLKKPGVYLASVLYERYVAVLAEQEREPATPQAFGLMLRDFGYIRRRSRQGRTWLIQ